jgi:tetratricopeptide (TPR) repeat protein
MSRGLVVLNWIQHPSRYLGRYAFKLYALTLSVCTFNVFTFNVFTFCALTLGALTAPVHASEDTNGGRIDDIRDHRYGVALYHYYQDDFFSALSELAVAKARGGIQGHGRYPDLLQGGIELSYGMDRHAEALFSLLLSEDVDAPVRDQAWYFVGKMYYQRGAYSDAAGAFEKVDKHLPLRFVNEFHYLNALLPTKASAEQQHFHLQHISSFGPWRAYALYNAAMHDYQRKHYDQVHLYLTEALLYLMPGEEGLQLRDRIHVARAFTYLAEERLFEAVEAFKQVSLSTPITQHALLGLGWSALKFDQPELALSSWERLAGQSVAGQAVQEALLGVPYVFDKLGAKTEALAAFTEAEQRFQDEIGKLDDIRASLTTDVIFAHLVTQQAQVSSHWFHRNKGIDLNPISPYLANLIAQQHFQALLKDLRDLTVLQASAEAALVKTAGLNTVLDARVLSQTEIRERALRSDFEAQTEALQARYQKLGAKLQDSLDTTDYLQLLNGEAREYLLLVEGAEHAVAELASAGEDVLEYQQKLARFKGVLLWQATQEHAENRWQTLKQKQALESLLKQLQERSHRVVGHLSGIAKPDVYSDRLVDLSSRSKQALMKTQALRSRIERHLQRVIFSELDSQEHRLNYYLTQARMNIARILDEQFQQQGGPQ